MNNGHAEFMVGTVKRTISSMVLREEIEWDLTLPDVLYGYRRSNFDSGHLTFEILYEKKQKMTASDPSDLVGSGSDASRVTELTERTSLRSSLVFRKLNRTEKGKKSSNPHFEVRD